MIDEKKIIEKLENRIDVFIQSQPKEKNSLVVETIREFIHMLQLEADEQAKE